MKQGRLATRRMPAPADVKKPVGRPPATDSAATRRRIMVGARACFSRHGYERTTNKDIAAAAGITAGAIYHYFPSKQDLFVAVWRDMQATVLEGFEAALEGRETLPEKVKAIMDVAADLHAKDRSLAAFVAFAPIEIQRHEELRREIGDDALVMVRYFDKLVRDSRRDLAPGVDVESVVNLLVAVASGLSQFGAVTRTARAHRAAVENFKLLVDNELFGVSARAATGSKPARSSRAPWRR